MGETEEYRESGILGKVIRVLRGQPGLNTENLYHKVGGNRQDFFDAINHAAEQGTLYRDKWGKSWQWSIGAEH
jgi:hypothetical protein